MSEQKIIAKMNMPRNLINKLLPPTEEKKPTINVFNKNNTGKCNKCEEKDDIIHELELELKSKGHNTVLSKTRIIQNNIKYKIGNKTGKLLPDTFRCRYDHHDYTGIPVPLPETYSNNIFHCNYKFCSIECAHTFNIKLLNDNKTEERKRLFIKMIKDMYGKGLEDKIELHEAPPLEVLIVYGGIMEIEEFRSKFTSLNYEYIVYNPIIKPVAQCIEERKSEIAMQKDTRKSNNN